MLEAVSRWLSGVFSSTMIIILLACGAWSSLMVAPALRERGLDREAIWARWGGLFYLALGFFGYLGVTFFFSRAY